jgi:hypothetical protein
VGLVPSRRQSASAQAQIPSIATLARPVLHNPIASERGSYVDGPPCVARSRSGTRPICPEGERYCGIPVWRNYTFEELPEKRVM